jgi:E3 ubiquitin-protein ligase Topors
MDEEMGEEVKAPPLPVPSLHIKGAAKEIEPRRISLLERLAKAKAEAVTLNGTSINGMTADPTQPPALTHSILEPLPRRATVHETVRDRLQLQTKLESERATLKHNINESRAQELRRRLLDAKANRQAAETDVTLRKMDRLERAVELRRRLMVLKIMAAETEGERKQRELKERLMAEKRRRMLREMLLVRKTDVKGLDGGEGGEQLGATVGEAVAVA